MSKTAYGAFVSRISFCEQVGRIRCRRRNPPSLRSFRKAELNISGTSSGKTRERVSSDEKSD